MASDPVVCGWGLPQCITSCAQKGLPYPPSPQNLDIWLSKKLQSQPLRNYASLVGLPKQADALKWKAAVALKLECLQKCPRDHKSLVYRPQPDPLAAAGEHGSVIWF